MALHNNAHRLIYIPNTGLATPRRPRARGRRSAATRTTTILGAATTTSTIKHRCAVARSVFVWVVCSAVVCV